MRVLVACEFSGRVRDAFIARGHDAVSLDPAGTEVDGPHITGPLTRHVMERGWDLMIAFPPCTHVANSGAKWFHLKRDEQEKALMFMHWIMVQDWIEKVAMENPVGVFSTYWRKPDQIIQPWQFGHGETKATCLWLKNLPLLRPTNIVEGREPRTHMMPGSKNQAKNRSRTFTGIAEAMAAQWG